MIDYADLMTKAERLRRRLGEDSSSPIDIFSLAQGIEKLTLVFYPMGRNLSGMCVKGTEGNCLIAVNSSMTLGRQRFSLAHEFYHLYYDENMRSVCAASLGNGKDIEKKADAFAAYFLMPRVALIEKAEQLADRRSGRLELSDIIRIEQYFGVSHQTALYQLYSCGLIRKSELAVFVNESIRKKAAAMGFQTDLYRPSPEERRYCTYGHYIEQANELLKKELISDGKFEELLLDAFREDLVYGTDEDGEVID